jgi:hypothetical protein
MELTHSCFISYRNHDHNEHWRFFVDTFYNELRSQLSVLTDLPLFLDQERLEGGDRYNEVLATKLCRSACMVVLYTPTYFNSSHTYCAREFRAMEMLEVKRFTYLSQPDRGKGLIIPVIVRGMEYLPLFISKSRLCHDFTGYALQGGPLAENSPKVRMIAEYIEKRCRVLERLEADDLPCCDNYKLPRERTIKQWLERRIGIRDIHSPFPGRAGGNS